jgi:hypothetical protein
MTMSEGLTLSATGAAELSNSDRDEIIRNIRAIVQEVENLYRPAREIMPPGKVSTDPVMLALYSARDNLIEAENSILRLLLQNDGKPMEITSSKVDIDVDDLFPSPGG